ncbi:hypothetical protein C0991_009864 [Blastosporella zonata]|nr:hypothetical protein C0991_009864 [Blastosporella zonata]
MAPQIPQLAVEDCDEAIKLEPTYVKAINRRGIAFEILERFDDALNDFIISASLDVKTITLALSSVDRVLRRLAVEKAAKILDNQGSSLPSLTVISAYFATFRSRLSPDSPDRGIAPGDARLLQSMQALSIANYGDAMDLVNEAMDEGISISWRAGRAEARNLRGTFRYLTGDLDGAKADFLASLAIIPTYTQNFVKLARIHIEQNNEAAALECFEDAILFDGNDPDIYHHRGQALLEAKKHTLAAEDFDKSISLDGQFILSHLQLAVAQCKAGHIEDSEITLQHTLELFPKRSEPLNCYGEFLLEQHRYESAVEMLERAYELESRKAVPNVASLLNQGRALFRWKHDINAAKHCCAVALLADPESLDSIAMLAQISLQCGDFEEAISHFEDLVAAAHRKSDRVAALMCQLACAAHMKFLKEYPDLAPELEVFARESHLTLTRKHLARLQHTSILDLTADL